MQHRCTQKDNALVPSTFQVNIVDINTPERFRQRPNTDSHFIAPTSQSTTASFVWLAEVTVFAQYVLYPPTAPGANSPVLLCSILDVVWVTDELKRSTRRP